MNPSSKSIELLAPAGDFEKLEIAIHYGADAVYVAGKDFSLRNFSGNFSLDELQRAKELAQAHNVKLYLACNIYSRNFEQDPLSRYVFALDTRLCQVVYVISFYDFIIMCLITLPHGWIMYFDIP